MLPGEGLAQYRARLAARDAMLASTREQLQKTGAAMRQAMEVFRQAIATGPRHQPR